MLSREDTDPECCQKYVYSPKMYPPQNKVKTHDPILNFTHIWSTISNPSWAPKVQSEMLRKPQNVPAQRIQSQAQSAISQLWPSMNKFLKNHNHCNSKSACSFAGWFQTKSWEGYTIPLEITGALKEEVTSARPQNSSLMETQSSSIHQLLSERPGCSL